MLFFPVVMNAIQYYIIDSFIKDQKPLDHEPISNEDSDSNDEDEDRHHSRSHSIDGNARADHDDDGKKITKGNTEVSEPEIKNKPRLKVDPKSLDEYDPAIDGEEGGSSGDPDGPRPTSGDRVASKESS